MEKVQKCFSGERFEHSLNVAKEAKILAGVWGINQKKAYLAGLLHDVAKELTLEHIKTNQIKHHTSLEKCFYEYPKIWHALIAPDFLICIKYKFLIDDVAVLNAVKWHTTGKAKMTKLDQILYIADYIEPKRDFADLEYIKVLANKDLDKAVFALAISSIISLTKRNLKIHPATVKCKNYYNDKLLVEDTEKITRDLWRLWEYNLESINK